MNIEPLSKFKFSTNSFWWHQIGQNKEDFGGRRWYKSGDTKLCTYWYIQEFWYKRSDTKLCSRVVIQEWWYKGGDTKLCTYENVTHIDKVTRHTFIRIPYISYGSTECAMYWTVVEVTQEVIQGVIQGWYRGWYTGGDTPSNHRLWSYTQIYCCTGCEDTVALTWCYCCSQVVHT